MVKKYYKKAKTGKKRKIRGHTRKKKRKAPKMTEATINKILKNPRTPKQLKPYWRKRLKSMR